MAGQPAPAPRSRRWIRLLLIFPFIGLLFPSWYAHADPHLAGIPFFIWYQFLWVLLGVAATGLVYLVDRGADEP